MSVLNNVKSEHFDTHSKYINSEDHDEEKKHDKLEHITTDCYHQLQQDLFEENIWLTRMMLKEQHVL